jgi:CheY-like chemotaxis protein
MRFKGESVLVLDDEAIVRRCCDRILTPEGLVVETAGECSEGLMMMEEKSYDLVITDLKMPRMDGIQLMEKIRELAPEVKVIFVTGYVTAGTREMVLGAGAIGCIEKPFSPEELLSAVSEALRYPA